jgi:hypothetical protein
MLFSTWPWWWIGPTLCSLSFWGIYSTHRFQRSQAVAGITATPQVNLSFSNLRVFASSKFSFHLPSPLGKFPPPSRRGTVAFSDGRTLEPFFKCNCGCGKRRNRP